MIQEIFGIYKEKKRYINRGIIPQSDIGPILTFCPICDFHDFGLIFAGQMHCLPQRLKSMLFEIFSNGGCPKGTRSMYRKNFKQR